jgi:hypothetical protein
MMAEAARARTGTLKRGETCEKNLEQGSPPSSANAQMTRPEVARMEMVADEAVTTERKKRMATEPPFEAVAS